MVTYRSLYDQYLMLKKLNGHTISIKTWEMLDNINKQAIVDCFGIMKNYNKPIRGIQTNDVLLQLHIFKLLLTSTEVDNDWVDHLNPLHQLCLVMHDIRWSKYVNWNLILDQYQLCPIISGKLYRSIDITTVNVDKLSGTALYFLLLHSPKNISVCNYDIIDKLTQYQIFLIIDHNIQLLSYIQKVYVIDLEITDNMIYRLSHNTSNWFEPFLQWDTLSRPSWIELILTADRLQQYCPYKDWKFKIKLVASSLLLVKCV